MRTICRFRWILWIHIQVLQQTSLRESRFVVDSAAAVTMSTGSNFKVKRAVYSEKMGKINMPERNDRLLFFDFLYLLVLFGSKNWCQIFGHVLVIVIWWKFILFWWYFPGKMNFYAVNWKLVWENLGAWKDFKIWSFKFLTPLIFPSVWSTRFINFLELYSS